MQTNAKSLIAFAALTAIGQPAVSDAASPEVSNIRATQRAGTQLVDIFYDVTAPKTAH